MRKFIIFLLLMFTAVTVWAAPSRLYTYTAGETIVSDEVTANEDALFNYLTAGVDNIVDGIITNSHIHASANIQSDKLNLSAMSQNVGINAGGTLTNAGTTALSGAVAISGALTVTGNSTFSGTTIADLGTVTTAILTTADINAGTFDGTIGGTTPAAITGTTLKANTSLELATGSTVTGILDEDAMGSNSATQLATQQSIKAYADDSKVELGTWASATVGSSAQVSNDSFIVGYLTDDGSGNYTFSLKTDASSTPTTIRVQSNVSGGDVGASHSFSCPIKASDYYLITQTTGTVTAFIIPLE